MILAPEEQDKIMGAICRALVECYARKADPRVFERLMIELAHVRVKVEAAAGRRARARRRKTEITRQEH